MQKIDVLDHGFVRLVDSMGSDLSVVRGEQATNNKQGRQVGGCIEQRQVDVNQYFKTCRASFLTYKVLLDAGWPRELARSVLPVSTYSHMFCTVNLLNLLKFLTLRCDAPAQYEIRVYADAMRELIRPVVPVCLEAWEAGNG
jgi:thymidylate synthase (FAD)